MDDEPRKLEQANILYAKTEIAKKRVIAIEKIALSQDMLDYQRPIKIISSRNNEIGESVTINRELSKMFILQAQVTLKRELEELEKQYKEL